MEMLKYTWTFLNFSDFVPESVHNVFVYYQHTWQNSLRSSRRDVDCFKGQKQVMDLPAILRKSLLVEGSPNNCLGNMCRILGLTTVIEHTLPAM